MRAHKNWLLASVTAAAMLFGTGVAGAAEEPLDLQSPEVVMSTLAPDKTLLGESADEHAEQLADGTAFEFDTGIEPTEDAEEVPTFGFTIDGQIEAAESDEYSVLDMGDETYGYVKTSDAGGQVIFSTEEEEGVSDFSIEFANDVVEVLSVGNGDTAVVFADESSVVVQPAWAVDGSGDPLETSYEFEGNVLIQTVDVDESTDFPVVADPAWSYSATYSTSKSTPAQIRKAVTRAGMFNKYFPVKGAPSSMPVPNQLLPLKVGTYNFECRFQTQFSGTDATSTWWGFQFKATAKHIDGAGSTIRFSKTRSFNTGKNYLIVYAYIVRTNPAGLPQWLYKETAKANWQIYANRLQNVWRTA